MLISLQVLVRRVAQARRAQTQGTVPHAAGRTQPLTPLDEKAEPGMGPPMALGVEDERNGFWSKLKCW